MRQVQIILSHKRDKVFGKWPVIYSIHDPNRKLIVWLKHTFAFDKRFSN